MDKNPNCIFCNIDCNFIIYETENLLLHFDPYPLVEGHLIISSKDHYGCLGELPNNIVDELSALKLKVRGILAKTYSVVSFYEHGRAGGFIATGAENCYCHHFHLHSLPFAGPLHEDLDLQFRGKPLNNFFILKAYFEGYGDYLYFEDWIGNAKFYPTEGKVIHPHYLRTLILRYLGEPYHADWKVYANRGESQHIFNAKKLRTNLRPLLAAQVI